MLSLHLKLVCDVRKQCDLTSALDSCIELALMLCARSGDSSGKDLSALADKLSELCGILVINISDLILTEDTNLFSLAVIKTRGTRIVFCSIHTYEILLLNFCDLLRTADHRRF